MRTSEDQLKRMEALVRRIAENYSADVSTERDEARAIVAEIDRVHLIDARQVVADYLPKETGCFLNGSCDSGDYVKIAELAIAKGRELERAEWVVAGKAAFGHGSDGINRTYDDKDNLCHE